MYAAVTIPLQEADSVLAVPLQALSHGDSPTVLVVDSGGVVEERHVSVGIETSTLAEIRSGLAEGDLVVVGDRSGLVAGLAVTPKIVDSPSSE
jgi:multidrug efflux pump subunit AcrA (membrane-fusion protein)